jgi:hypothetical protein
VVGVRDEAAEGRGAELALALGDWAAEVVLVCGISGPSRLGSRTGGIEVGE